jgi:hypothetical protein
MAARNRSISSQLITIYHYLLLFLRVMVCYAEKKYYPVIVACENIIVNYASKLDDCCFFPQSFALLSPCNHLCLTAIKFKNHSKRMSVVNAILLRGIYE